MELTPTPVTVVTGFLGAGKTTLVNHVLKAASGRRYAVIVNEFGQAGIDGELIETGEEELIELSSGCICCVVRGDLIRSLRGLLKRDRALDGVLIETTGVANPSPVIQTFAADPVLATLARLDAVVTVVDGTSGTARLTDSPDAAAQVALASLIVLNKASEAADRAALEAALRRLNPHAPILRADRGRVDPALLLDTGSFSLDRVEAELAEAEDHAHDHVAANGIASLSLVADAPLDGPAVERWLADLLSIHGADILRTKGVLAIAGEERRVIVQAVNMLHEGDYGRPWGAAPRRSKLVFIGRNLHAMPLRAGFDACRVPLPA